MHTYIYLGTILLQWSLFIENANTTALLLFLLTYIHAAKGTYIWMHVVMHVDHAMYAYMVYMWVYMWRLNRKEVYIYGMHIWCTCGHACTCNQRIKIANI
jgi:hypothetical protein